MIKTHKPVVKVITSAVLGIIVSGSVHAAGFSLYGEGNAIGASNFSAGSAAEAYDASTAWYNPAGLALIKDKQTVVAGTVILASGKLTGTSTYTTPQGSYQQQFTDISGGKNALIPATHYAQPIGENATFSISVLAPFGLATDWGTTSPVRYAATKSQIKTIDLSPAVGGKIHENLSIGLGLDVQYASLMLNRVVGDPVLGTVAGNARAFDSVIENEGTSIGFGFHAGILGMFNDNHTRVGFNYQSQVKHKLNGHSAITGPLSGAALTMPVQHNDLYSNNLTFPAISTLSAYHDVNEDWAVLGSVVYTQWSSVKTLVLTNVAGPAGLKLESEATLNYKNAWRAALGANYKVNEDMTFRFGGGFDQTPTNNIDRDVRLPDGDRWTIALGGDYKVRPDMTLGFGWTHFFFDKGRINKTDSALSVSGGTGSVNVIATGKTRADLLAAQVVWVMDHADTTKA